eukprot:scaffold3499_cov117-Isochrysis_galbana.AAC.11
MTDPPIDDTQAREPEAPGTNGAKQRAPVHGHTGDVPAFRQGTLRHPRTVVDRPGPKPRRGCGCEFLQGWLPCWLLALHHVLARHPIPHPPASSTGLQQCLNPACGTEAGQLGHLFNRDHMGATNIGRNMARLLDGRPLISAPQGLDTELLDLDAALHNH